MFLQLLNDLKYIDFQTGNYADFNQFGYFANFEEFKTDSNFADFGQVTIDPTHSSLLLWECHGCFTGLEKTLGCGKQSKASLFDNKFKNHT